MNATDDRELERYLQGGDTLSRAYAELKSERPTPALDQAVLAQAKAALRSQPHTRRGYFGWPALTAIAATVLLSFTLVMRVVLESEMPAKNSASAPATPVPATVDAPAAEALGASTAQDEYAPASTERDQSFSPPPPPAGTGSPIEKRRAVIEEEIRTVSESALTVDEPNEQDVAASSAAKSRAAAPKPDVASVAATPERQPARERVEESPPAPVAGYGVLHAEPQAKKEQTRPPQEWLAEIERMRASGESEAADRELELFKQAYPGYLESQASPADK